MKITAIEFDWPKDPSTFVMRDADDKPVDYEKDPLGGKIGIKYLKAGTIKKIGDKAKPMVAKFALNGAVLDVESELSTVVDNEETAVEAIASWSNFYDGDPVGKKYPHGQPVPCNDETKRLFSEEDGYMRALQIFRAETNRIVRKELEEEEKNLLATPNG